MNENLEYRFKRKMQEVFINHDKKEDLDNVKVLIEEFCLSLDSKERGLLNIQSALWIEELCRDMNIEVPKFNIQIQNGKCIM